MSRRQNTVDDLMDRIRTDRYQHWIWMGAISGSGYGVARVQTEYVLLHRVMYEEFVGPIPLGYVIDHLCRVPQCCNPDHLEAVTDGVNSARGAGGFALTGRCKSGRHDVTLPDAIIVSNKGARTCRECRNEGKRRSYWKDIA